MGEYKVKCKCQSVFILKMERNILNFETCFPKMLSSSCITFSHALLLFLVYVEVFQNQAILTYETIIQNFTQNALL